MKTETNISAEHKKHFDALVSGMVPFCLFSAFLDGAPVSVICEAWFNEDSQEYEIFPQWVSVTPEMRLTDHEGVEAS